VGDRLREKDFDSAFAPLLHDAFGVAYRILGDVDDAEEAAVDAMTRARLRWTKLQQLPYRDAWVMHAAANAAIAKARARDLTSTPDDTSGAEEDNAALRAVVVDAIAGLPRRERDVVALRYVAGVTEVEIALCLGISVDSVKKHILDASARIGDRVGREASEAEPVAS
jgi:RNA polymerase sigma factor (sigma-70 family)